MKKELQAIAPVVAVLFLGVLAICKPLPDAPKQTEPHHIPSQEQTTEPVQTALDRYISEQAEEANAAIMNNVMEIVKVTEPETEEPTEPEWEPLDFVQLPAETQRAMKDVCDKYEIAFELLIAICKQESGLNPLAVGDNGRAFGLGQIRAEYWGGTAEALGLYDWKTDAIQNSEMVCYIMARQLNDNHLTLRDALNIYRSGTTKDTVEPDGETYVEKIMNNLEWVEINK